MHVGYVGLGAMGRPLATRLLRDERPLVVWDINPAAVAAFESLGAQAAASAADLARRCHIILLCLPRSSDVETLLFGPSGMAGHLAPGTVLVDQTSGIPSETLRFAQRLAAGGVSLVDAPVSGGAATVDSGTVAIMLSGPEDACAQALPVLKTISANVFRCGERVGNGQALKAVNNMIMACNRLATLELVALGRKMGLTLESMTRMLNRGSGHNHITNVMLPALQQGRHSNNFFMSLMLKDIDQAVALGIEVGAPMPIANVARSVYQLALNTLGERSQLDDIAKLVETMAAVRFNEPQPARQAD